MTSFRRSDGEVRLPWESTVRASLAGCGWARWGCLHSTLRMRCVFVLRARPPVRACWVKLILLSLPRKLRWPEHEHTGGGWIVNIMAVTGMGKWRWSFIGLTRIVAPSVTSRWTQLRSQSYVPGSCRSLERRSIQSFRGSKRLQWGN